MGTPGMDSDTELIERARGLLLDAPRILVMTGAGISAESGVPTFRGPDRLWKSLSPQDLATPEAFAKDARLVWEWYEWRRELIRDCTQNVDGLARVQGSRPAPASLPVPIRWRCTERSTETNAVGAGDWTMNHHRSTRPHSTPCRIATHVTR
jgi:NAD-dependent SIR2 family protein deacetylase